MTKAKAKPYLAKGTAVFVKDNASHDWISRRFKAWSRDGKMVCYIGRIPSLMGKFKDTDEVEWTFWRVAVGRFAGETNFNEEDNYV